MIAAVAGAHGRLLGTLADVDDDTVRAPSRLPGWSVGHVLTHLARNADGFTRIFAAAQRGEVADQYPGGAEQRRQDIDAGAARSAAEMSTDLGAAIVRLATAWDETSTAVWTSGRGRAGGRRVPLTELPFRRLREVELHHVDLGLGYEPDAWCDEYVDAELVRSLDELPERLPAGTTVTLQPRDRADTITVVAAARVDGRASPAPQPVRITLPVRTVVAWLVDRHRHPALPALAPWQREHRTPPPV
jgi:maleylpyruvate isomerase